MLQCVLVKEPVLFSGRLGTGTPKSKSASNLSLSNGSESPVKINLDYLKQQQAIISSAVDSAAEGVKGGIHSSSVGNCSNRERFLEMKSRSQGEPPSSSPPVLLPLSHIKIVKASTPVNESNIKVKQTNLKPIQLDSKLFFAVSNKHTGNCDTKNSCTLTSQCTVISTAEPTKPKTVVSSQTNKPIKMLINSSNNMSRISACSSQGPGGDSNAKPSTLKLYKVQLTGKSAMMQPTTSASNQNFVKLELSKLRAVESKASTQLRVAKSTSLIRRNSSVVTNLVTRLEKQGYGTKDDMAVASRRSLDELAGMSKESTFFKVSSSTVV